MEKIKENKHFLILLYYLVILLLYNYTEQVTKPEYIMVSELDSHIPFIKEMVIPYIIWYVYISVVLVYLGMNSRKDFYRLSLFMFMGMTICFLIYLIFPNGQNLRPIVRGTDYFSRLIRKIYISDTPTNSAPSIHVLNSMAVHISIINCNKFKKRKCLKFISFFIMLSIIASTVMIKQHSILDVLYGIGLSVTLYIVVYKINILQWDRGRSFVPKKNI